MKIAMFSDTYYPQRNGVVTAISRFSRELMARGHEVHVFAPKGEEKPPSDGAVTHVYPSISIWFYPEFRSAFPLPGPRMLREMKKEKFDVVHSHTMFSMGVRAYTGAKILRIPLVGTFHTMISEYVRYISTRAEGSLKKVSWSVCKGYYNMCDCVVVPTQSMKELVMKRGFRKPVYVVPSGVDIHQFSMGDGMSIRAQEGLEGKKIVLYLGRLSYEKKIECLINAMDHVDNAILLVCGEGPIRKKLESLANGKNVLFKGYISEEKKASYYKAADVFAFPSTGDTQGLVLLEAMASGTPVVAVRAQGSVDIVDEGKDGLFAEPDNPRDLAEKITQVINNPRMRNMMSSNARKKSQDYDWSKCTDILLGLYEKMISEGSF